MPSNPSSKAGAALLAQIVRYTGTGAVCAVASNVLMIAGSLVGIPYLPMAFATFALVTPLAYLLHSRFTFGETLSARRFVRFTSGMTGGFLLSLLSLSILCSGFRVPVFIATPATTAFVFATNYLSARWAIILHSRPT